MKNTTLFDNTIKLILRRVKQHYYKGVATNLESEMQLALSFDKVKRGGLCSFVKESKMFDHSEDIIILIRLNSDGAKGKDGEYTGTIDTTHFDVDVYPKGGKRTKAVGQFTDSGRGGVTEGAAAGLSAVRRKNDALYYVAACVLRAASKLLQNDTEKNFSELVLGEEIFQKILHTCWSAQGDLGDKFKAERNYVNPGVTAGRVLDLDSESYIVALPAYLAGVVAN